MPYGINCDLSGLCFQRLMSRVPMRTGILPSLAAARVWRGRGEGLFCTVMERSIHNDSVIRKLHCMLLRVLSNLVKQSPQIDGCRLRLASWFSCLKFFNYTLFITIFLLYVFFGCSQQCANVQHSQLQKCIILYLYKST